MTLADMELTSDAMDFTEQSIAVLRAEGREAFSECYEYELYLSCNLDGGLSPDLIDAWLATTTTLRYGTNYVSGVVKTLTLEPSNQAHPLRYRATLVPKFWTLSLGRRSQIYQMMTALEVVEEVLGGHGVSFENQTHHVYPTSEYIVQYEESDLDFVNRLLEHWGASYHFDQTPDNECMVITDEKTGAEPLDEFDTLTFNSDPGGGDLTGWVSAIGRVHQSRTQKVIVRDYNWRASFVGADGSGRERQLQLRGENDADEFGYSEQRYYGDHFKDDAEGARIAKVRAEASMAQRTVFDGKLCAPGMRPGHTFQAQNMPVSDLELEYRIIEISTLIVQGHDGDPALSQEFKALEISNIFRPQRRTPKPKIYGFMHGAVDAEVVGIPAPIDSLGRYKILFPYDQDAAEGGQASRWVRMAQASSGADYGIHFPLHAGMEVALIHMDGDPDRPVIASAIPNVDTRSPVVQDNATQSRIRTRANILFELEDDA